MSDKNFNITRRIQSFRHASSGLRFVITTQHNARIHVAMSVIVGIAALLFRVDGAEARWLILAVVLVFAAEILNTAIEFLCDVVSPERNASVGKAKDIAASAVLVSATGAALIGISVFWPYLFG
jgi:diacylglycerol kinase (ATP)